MHIILKACSSLYYIKDLILYIPYGHMHIPFGDACLHVSQACLPSEFPIPLLSQSVWYLLWVP